MSNAASPAWSTTNPNSSSYAARKRGTLTDIESPTVRGLRVRERKDVPREESAEELCLARAFASDGPSASRTLLRMAGCGMRASALQYALIYVVFFDVPVRHR